jgi:hypothetical protein
MNPEEIKNQILDGMHPQPKETNGTPVDYQKIMEKGWSPSPKQRPTVEKRFDVLNELERKEKFLDKIPDIDNGSDAFSINTETSNQSSSIDEV